MWATYDEQALTGQLIEPYRRAHCPMLAVSQARMLYNK